MKFWVRALFFLITELKLYFCFGTFGSVCAAPFYFNMFTLCESQEWQMEGQMGTHETKLTPGISWTSQMDDKSRAGERCGAANAHRNQYYHSAFLIWASSTDSSTAHTGTCCYDNCGFLWQRREILKSTGTESLPASHNSSSFESASPRRGRLERQWEQTHTRLLTSSGSHQHTLPHTHR